MLRTGMLMSVLVFGVSEGEKEEPREANSE